MKQKHQQAQYRNEALTTSVEEQEELARYCNEQLLKEPEGLPECLPEPEEKDYPPPNPGSDEIRVMNSDEVLAEAEADKQKVQLPPLPDQVLPWTEQEEKSLKYPGDMKDLVQRMKFKLIWLWDDWGRLRGDERLIRIVNEVDSESIDDDSDMMYLKRLLVAVVDRTGKVLGQTDIAQELFSKATEPTGHA